jgi:hypothetical protein
MEQATDGRLADIHPVQALRGIVPEWAFTQDIGLCAHSLQSARMV